MWILLADFQTQPSARRWPHVKWLFFPFVLMAIGNFYLNSFFEELKLLFCYTLGGDEKVALQHLKIRQNSTILVMATYLLAVLANRFYLTAISLSCFYIFIGQLYDFWHRMTMDRSEISTLQEFNLEYLLMIANTGNIIRIFFFLSTIYAASMIIKTRKLQPSK